MLFRAIALSLAIIVGIGGVVVPLGTQTVEASPRKASKKKGYKKYSKKWWRQYRARQKKRRAMIARKRAIRLQQLRLAQAAGQDLQTAAKNLTPKATPKAPKASASERRMAAAAKSRTQLVAPVVQPETAVRLEDTNGWNVGNAAITVVGPAIGESSMAKHARTVGGVSTNSLRRNVIDQMIRENGWVVNDYQKIIGGRAVYIVVAQSQGAAGRVTSRVFHFTEVDGRIYNVATNSPVEQQERLVAESEKVLDSIQTRVRNTQRAAVKD